MHRKNATKDTRAPPGPVNNRDKFPNQTFLTAHRSREAHLIGEVINTGIRIKIVRLCRAVSASQSEMKSFIPLKETTVINA